MTWFKVDDSFHSHPKAMATDPAALGLWVIAGSWCGSNLTDGFVPDHVLPRLLPGSAKLAKKLIAAGLWVRTERGYQFHDWHSFNPTAMQVKAEREATAERQRRFRESRKESLTSSDANRSNGAKDHNGVSNGVSNGVTDALRNGAVTVPRPVGEGSLGCSLSSKPKSKTSNDQDHSSGGFQGGPHENELFSEPPDSKPPRKRGSPDRGTRIPDDFAVTPRMVTWAREHAPHVDGRRVTEEFIDYWKARAGRDATKLDWAATWRNAMRHAEDRTLDRINRTRNGHQSGTDENIRRMLAGTGTDGPPSLIALPGGTP